MKEVDVVFEDGLLVEEPVEEKEPDGYKVSQVVDEEFEGVGDVFEDEIKPSDSTAIITVVADNFGDIELARAEEAYEVAELDNKVAPILTETAKMAVGEAVKLQQDVLQSEVGYRLSKYEKRRRRRAFKNVIGVVIKALILVGVIGFIMGNASLRLRIVIVAKDVGDLVTALINGDENVSSNKLVEDLFRDLSEDLKEVNTIEEEDKGFDIEEED